MSRAAAPITQKGEQTRQRLLEAAEQEFGEKGFHRTSITSITQRAGVAQGTFYLYFPSKEEILRSLVEFMGDRMRRNQHAATEQSPSRLDVECEGFRQFLRFALENHNLYRIVMQSQFVDEQAHRAYYESLLERYAANLQTAQCRGEIRRGDPKAQAWLLMGIAYFFGLRYPNWEHRMPDPAVMDTVQAFITAGLRPERTN